MKKMMYFGVSLFFLTCSSCLIPSIHPLYTDEILVSDPYLEGSWENIDEDGQIWVFEQRGSSYYLTQQGDHEAYFEIHLVELQNHLFLDFKPIDVDRAWKSMFADDKNVHIEMNELLNALLLPVHLFSKIEIDDEEIRMWFLDPEWLEQLFKKRKVRIDHEVINDASLSDLYLITANSKELQKFVGKYADLEEAYLDYKNPLILRRIKS